MARGRVSCRTIACASGILIILYKAAGVAGLFDAISRIVSRRRLRFLIQESGGEDPPSVRICVTCMTITRTVEDQSLQSIRIRLLRPKILKLIAFWIRRHVSILASSPPAIWRLMSAQAPSDSRLRQHHKRVLAVVRRALTAERLITRRER